jgi:hypothetical protein
MKSFSFSEFEARLQDFDYSYSKLIYYPLQEHDEKSPGSFEPGDRCS